MDETTFRLFEDFDFENNQNFQAGWRSIETLIDPKKKRSEYLRAQAFFFAKNVSMFDYQQYLQWRNKQKIKSEGAANENRSNLGSLVHNLNKQSMKIMKIKTF
uniref:PEX14-like helix-turn-helix domain-containing protein n=2 Tax=Arion vulgaris TaxID=1028688 RepID=A0A0B7BEF8_9EUPU